MCWGGGLGGNVCVCGKLTLKVQKHVCVYGHTHMSTPSVLSEGSCVSL